MTSLSTPSKMIPPGPGSRPPLADLAALRDGPHAFLLQVAASYGPILRYPMGPLAVYLVCQPEGVKYILQDNHRNYCKDTFQYNLLSTITGRGLLTSDGDFWLRQRRLSQPAFHRSRIAGFAAMMTAAVDGMLARWDEYAARGEPLDVAAEMMHVALQIVGKAMFSAEIGDQADTLATATLTVLDHIVGRARTFGVVPEWLPTRGNRAHRRALRVLENAVYGTIHARRGPFASEDANSPIAKTTGRAAESASEDANSSAGKTTSKAAESASEDANSSAGKTTSKTAESASEDANSSIGKTTGRAAESASSDADGAKELRDLLAMLMAATDEATGERMSDTHLRDESMTMLIAGHETVASALAWTWQLLAEHPAAEARLHAELADVLGGRAATMADLPRLRYTEWVFQEALRLYPPAWIITRKALADDTICGYHVPAGALVVCSPYVTHRLAEFWDAPDTFRPERFSSEAAAGRHRFAYYPFGGGPRQCIGNYFAQVEASLIIASVAQHYRLRPVAGHPVEVEPGVTLRPKHGLLMRLEKRL